MERIIKLCMKEMSTKDNKRKFPSYFGYKVVAQEDGTLVTKEIPTLVVKDGVTETVMKARSFKVHPSADVEEQLDEIGNYPFFVTYDDEDVWEEDGSPANFITWDKDVDGKRRLDKNGKAHKVIVLRSIIKAEACPRTSISFDELDDEE